ncbi:MAG: hypothetical protein NT130_05775 [Candidatus Micrarchaeota archaeon]|nr:hypothetical protein [Candidatus Micrarchaeota archaeon]
MLERPFSVKARGFKTVISMSYNDENKEFMRSFTEEVKDDSRFTLHYAPHQEYPEDEINFDLLLDYASQVKAKMVVRINCRGPNYPGFEESYITKPVVKVLSHQLTEVTTLCKDKACIKRFDGSEEKQVIGVLAELQRRNLGEVSLDLVLRHLTALNVGGAGLESRIKKLKSYMKNGVVFISIEMFQDNPKDVESVVHECSAIIRILHDYYSGKQ